MGARDKRVKKQKFVDDHNQKPPLEALTSRQGVLINSITASDMVIVTGYSGTGKTYIPAVMAADRLMAGGSRNGINKLILTRPNVASGRSLGYRPGNLEEKMAEWFAEILGVLRQRMGAGAVDSCLRKGVIEMVPFESMRGRTFDDAFIILDEAQNTTPTEMKMFTTRIGQGTTTVVNGDIRQSDLKADSGLTALRAVTRDMDIPHIDFKVGDIVRSDLCREFIEGWMEYENR